MEHMIISWLGHSCFEVEYKGYRILLDPYEAGAVPGLLREDFSAHAVLSSHSHADHHSDRVELLDADGPNPFSITVIPCAHDDAGGTLRGMNHIHILEAGGIRVAHFGDVGYVLEQDKIEKIGHLDAMMVPVGGYYTIGPKEAWELCRLLEPNVVIPMHYRQGDVGYEVIGTLDPFLELCGNMVVRCSENRIEITKDMPKQVAVLSLPEQP